MSYLGHPGPGLHHTNWELFLSQRCQFQSYLIVPYNYNILAPPHKNKVFLQTYGYLCAATWPMYDLILQSHPQFKPKMMMVWNDILPCPDSPAPPRQGPTEKAGPVGLGHHRSNGRSCENGTPLSGEGCREGEEGGHEGGQVWHWQMRQWSRLQSSVLWWWLCKGKEVVGVTLTGRYSPKEEVPSLTATGPYRGQVF